jgi:hypothetical protein
MQCGIGNCVNAQVKIITMNAMNGYGGTKSHKQERVCERMCVRREIKGMIVNMNISETNSRDSGGPQNSPETSARQ